MAPESQDEGGLSISRRKVLQASGAAAVGSVAFTGTASANCPCDNHAILGKIEDTGRLECGTTKSYTLTLSDEDRIGECAECQGDKDVVVDVTATECKDGGEATCVDIRIDDANDDSGNCVDDGYYLSGGVLKAGQETVEFDCDDVTSSNQQFSKIEGACAPVNPKNGKRIGISHITLEVCVWSCDP